MLFLLGLLDEIHMALYHLRVFDETISYLTGHE